MHYSACNIGRRHYNADSQNSKQPRVKSRINQRRRYFHEQTVAQPAALFLAGAATSAFADITIGVTLSATGPAASLASGKKYHPLMPTTMGGQKVKYVVLDDATDPTAASKNARKLTSEDKRMSSSDRAPRRHRLRCWRSRRRPRPQ